MRLSFPAHLQHDFRFLNADFVPHQTEINTMTNYNKRKGHRETCLQFVTDTVEI